MSKEKATVVDVVEIVRHDGDAIRLPKGLPLNRAIKVLREQRDYLNEWAATTETIPVFVWDGAIALVKAIEEQFGMALQKSGWGGAQKYNIENGVGTTVSVPWGSFELPGLRGARVAMDTARLEGRLVFQVSVDYIRKYEEKVQKLLARTRVLATTQSIYRGKAFSITFTDDQGRVLAMPLVKFMATPEKTTIFSRTLEEAVENNIMTPIQYTAACREDGVPLKRGILLAGTYGTGKTLLANRVARVAVENSWTFVYVPKIAELGNALKVAQGFGGPVVVFGEDGENVAGADRTTAVNELLNTLDGIESKNGDIMTILTSNHPEQINEAMRRSGRVNVVLHVETPDAEAAERLVRHYGGNRIVAQEDLTEVGEVLAGEIPANIEDVVGRSKLAAIRRTKGKGKRMIIAADILAVAHDYKKEKELFRPVKPESDQVQSAKALGSALAGPLVKALGRMNGEDHRTEPPAVPVPVGL